MLRQIGSAKCYPHSSEICSDSRDNDGDGKVNCQDPDCFTSSDCSDILVDFGDAASKNIYDLTAWDIPIMDTYTGYTNLGTTILVGSNANYNYQGISGSSISLLPDDQILSFWYNRGSTSVSLTPRISFNDPDRPISGIDGVWYKMSEIRLGPGQTIFSSFVVPEGFMKQYALVNVNVNHTNTGQIVCDKIIQVRSNL